MYVSTASPYAHATKAIVHSLQAVGVLYALYFLMTHIYLCTGLGLPPDYLGSRALTELQPPPSTIGSSEFPFSIDGEY
jgi:hypothetical protein